MDEDRFRRILRAGQVLFREGDAGDCAWVIEDGEVEVSVTRGGRKQVISRVGPGALLGEMALINECPRTATLTALRDTRLIKIEPVRCCGTSCAWCSTVSPS